MAKAKKDLADQRKMLKQKMAEKREMSKKRKAGNADKDANYHAMTGNADGDVMALASSHSVEELKKMLAGETEAFGGMVEDDFSLRRSGLVGRRHLSVRCRRGFLEMMMQIGRAHV